MVVQYLMQLPYEVPLPVQEFAQNETTAFTQRISVDLLEVRSGTVLVYEDSDAEYVLFNFGPVIRRRIIELIADPEGNYDAQTASECFGVTVGYALWSTLGVESAEKFWFEGRLRSFRDSWREIFDDLGREPSCGRTELWAKFVRCICKSRTTNRERLAGN